MGQGQIITTICGNGQSGYSGDGGFATSATIGSAGGLTFDDAGNYYISENNNTIRKVSTTGIITKVAGNGMQGYTADGGLATLAQLHLSGFTTTDRSGNLYFSEIINNRIRRVDANTGILTTVVGNGNAGFSGDGGPATSAEINFPYGICFDQIGNLYIVDQLNYRIRKVDTFGNISTIAGTGTGGSNGDGGLATVAEIYSPIAICSDFSGNLYFTDSGRIRRIDLTTGIITAYAGDGGGGFAGDGGPAIAAHFSFPQFVVSDHFGNVYISDDNNDRVRKVDAGGIINTVAGNGIAGYNGDGGLADTSELNSPRGIGIDSCSNLCIVDNGNRRVRKVEFYPSCVLEHVNDLSKIEFKLFPNPTTNQLAITCKTNIKNINIINVIGQTVMQQSSNSDKALLNVEGLEPGLYFVVVTGTDSGSKVGRRFVKN